jgi:hypothetical protein
MNTESIRMLDCDGHVIESMSELAEFGDASIRWLAPGQKDVRRLPFPCLDGIHWHNNQRVEGNLKRKRTNASASEWVLLRIGRLFFRRRVLKKPCCSLAVVSA